MKEGIIKNTYEAVLKEMQTLISISYLLVVGIGMLFNYHKYEEFGINIFDYADVFDFLIAPFSDSKILLFSMLSLMVPYLLYKFDFMWKSKYPKTYSRMSFGWDEKSWYKLFTYFSFAFLLIFYLYISADLYGKISKKQILKRGTTSIRYSDNEIKEGKMIGKTKDIMFLLVDENVEAIPITSLVKEIQIVK